MDNEKRKQISLEIMNVFKKHDTCSVSDIVSILEVMKTTAILTGSIDGLAYILERKATEKAATAVP